MRSIQTVREFSQRLKQLILQNCTVFLFEVTSAGGNQELIQIEELLDPLLAEVRQGVNEAVHSASQHNPGVRTEVLPRTLIGIVSCRLTNIGGGDISRVLAACKMSQESEKLKQRNIEVQHTCNLGVRTGGRSQRSQSGS